MQLVLNASKNEEFVKDNPDLVASARANDEGSSTFAPSSFKEVYMPPEEEAELLEMFSTSVVQDFGDDYHLTKAERELMQERYAKFFKLRNNYTKKIRNLGKYIEAYRLCMEIVNDIAETNGLYKPKDFKEKVLAGRIQINGLEFPKFQGKRKKKINWELVAEYVNDPTKDIREITEMDDVAKETQHIDPSSLMSKDEIEECIAPVDQETWENMEYKVSTAQVEPYGALEIGKKQQRRIAKLCPMFIQSLKDAAKVPGSTRSKSKIWSMSDEEIEVLEAYDSKIRGKNSVAMPEFKGNFLDDRAVDAYLHALDEYESENTFVNYNGRLLTEAQADELEYVRALEDCDWNIRNLYDNKDKDKKAKKAEKNDKKRIETLRKMLANAQEKEDLRSKGYSDKEIQAHMEKKEAAGKKNKKKKKKAKRKMNSIILDAVKSQDKNFKKYKKRMERM